MRLKEVVCVLILSLFIYFGGKELIEHLKK
jgi:hypothetical protein